MRPGRQKQFCRWRAAPNLFGDLRTYDCAKHSSIGDRGRNLRRWKPKVHRGRHSPQPLDGEQRDAVLGCVREGGGHQRSACKSALCKAGSDTINLLDELPECECSASDIVYQRCSLRGAFGLQRDQIVSSAHVNRPPRFKQQQAAWRGR
jgi:hypothetical protein